MDLLKIFLSIFLLGTVHAESPKYALVRKIQGLENLPETLSRQLQVISLKTVTAQTDYELLLSGNVTPEASLVKVIAVESEIARVGNRFRLEARLLDLKTQKLLNRASKNDIREQDLVRLYQAALESLFMKDELSKEEKTRTERSNTKKSRPENRETIVHITPIPPTAIDFKQRIIGMKAEADQGLEETKNELVSKETKRKEKTSSLSHPHQVARQSSVVEKPLREEKTRVINYQRTYQFYSSYESRQVDSNYYIGTATKSQFLNLSGAAQLPLNLAEGKIKLHGDITYNHAITSEVKPPSIYQIGTAIGWYESLWNLRLGLKYDSTFFVTLPSPGEGLLPESLTTGWGVLGGDYNLEYKGKLWGLSASYGIPVYTQTTFKPMKSSSSWEGSFVSVGVVPPVTFKNWQTKISFNQIDITSQGDTLFTLKESRYALSLWRSL